MRTNSRARILVLTTLLVGLATIYTAPSAAFGTDPYTEHLTPGVPTTNVQECYAEGEKPSVTIPQDAFSYVVTEDPLNVFHVAATPPEGEYTNVPAAIALGYTHTESQTVIITYDLSYVKPCIVEEPEQPVTPPTDVTPGGEPAPAPATDVDVDVAPPAAVVPALAATGIDDFPRWLPLAAGAVVLAGITLMVLVFRRRTT